MLLQPELLQSGLSKAEVDSVPNKGKKQIPKALLGPSANDVSDLTRRTGDLSVYKYYFASIGWFWCLASGVSALFYTIGSNFPSKYPKLDGDVALI